MKILISPTNEIAGFADETYDPGEGWLKLDYPEGFEDEHFNSLKYVHGLLLIDAEPFIEQNLTRLKSRLKDRATDLRWQIETGGLTLPSGVTVKTGIDDQNRITTVIANAELAGVETVDFKAHSGWVTLSIADLHAVAAAIAAHVQACFSAERAHHEAIDALGSINEVSIYNINAAWPGESV